MPASLATTAPTRFLDAAGIRFAYRRFGTPAGPPLVFIQHFMGNLDNFDPAIADALATGREIILFDNAGVGSSTGTAPGTVEGIAAGAASFIDGLGLSTVDLLGHSMGGEVAQLVALDHPDLVRRLVLVGTGPRGGDTIARQGPDVGPLFGQRDQLGQDMWLPIMFSPSKESQAAGRAFIARITARTADRDILVSSETIAAHRAAARGWASAPADDFGYLARITQPALVVNGSDDVVIPTINSYYLYQHLPDAELMLLPDSGHGAHFQHVERFARRVIDFLDVQPHDAGLPTGLRPRRAKGNPMIFGLNLPNYSRLGYRDAVTAIAERADELGYSSLWTSDHILLPATLPEPYGNLLESLTTLGYLAARTKRIRLGTGILVLPQRDPLLVAKQAATIHHLSGGRLTLGVGVGWIEQEYAYLRSDFRSRGRIADEYIAAMRVLFETGAPEFHGARVDYSGALFSPRPAAHLPIVVGGTSGAALKRAATLGDGWHGINQSPGEVTAAIATMEQYGRAEHFRISLRTRMRIGDANGDRETRARGAGVGLWGDATALTEQVEQYARAGVDELVIEPAATDLADFLDQLTRFARKVVRLG